MSVSKKIKSLEAARVENKGTFKPETALAK